MGPQRTRRAIAAAAFALITLLAGACGSSGGVSPTPEVEVRERDVEFETSDGFTLTGKVFGSGEIGVTLAHEFPATDASGWYTPARELARAGYMALAFNFRGYGDSEGPKQAANATIDVRSAGEHLRELGAKELVFIGASMGGTASIIAAQDQEPLAVVSISAPTRFMGLDASLASNAVQRPVLLMASRGDEDAFRAIDTFERALPNPEDTKIYDGDAHGTALLADTPEAVDEIISFLKRYAPIGGLDSQLSPDETGDISS